MLKNSALLLIATFLFVVFNFSFGAINPVFVGGGGQVVVLDELICINYSPNPSSNGIVQMTAIDAEADVLSVKVSDLNGGVVFLQSYNSHQISADLSNLPVGEYIIEVKASNCTTTGRCIVHE